MSAIAATAQVTWRRFHAPADQVRRLNAATCQMFAKDGKWFCTRACAAASAGSRFRHHVSEALASDVTAVVAASGFLSRSTTVRARIYHRHQ